MKIVFLISILSLCCMIFISDFRHRTVNVLLFIFLFFSLSIYSLLLKGDPQLILSNAALNLLVLFILISALAIYLKTFRNIPLKEAIGKGDVAFFICIVSYFSPTGFLSFLISSFIFTLVLHLSIVMFPKLNQQNTSIPLAGFQAIWLAVVLSLSHLSISTI
ncbi:type IV leader peptidase family protein [Lacibacter cauensis]|uniref:Type IV leader peptidase family protein n=1 Tax=Lacibacter cauensis TaxID=510947 RepID=A0A562S870_9BACT|nr:type IV leader peptidase family protein [Lacibacter cauensis]